MPKDKAADEAKRRLRLRYAASLSALQAGDGGFGLTGSRRWASINAYGVGEEGVSTNFSKEGDAKARETGAVI